jgi:D-sedoheptulose 7-phosphate isomerase
MAGLIFSICAAVDAWCATCIFELKAKELSMRTLLLDAMEQSIKVKRAFFREQIETIEQVVALCVGALNRGAKIFFCGNGGSAADSQHLAAELAGRYLRDRDPLPAIALTTDTSKLTAIGNDYGYAEVFSRQLRALARPGDVLFAISTSGNSENVLRAVAASPRLGVTSVGLLGGNGGKLGSMVDLALVVPSDRPDRVQESHIVVGHAICEQIERLLFCAAPTVHPVGPQPAVARA